VQRPTISPQEVTHAPGTEHLCRGSRPRENPSLHLPSRGDFATHRTKQPNRWLRKIFVSQWRAHGFRRLTDVLFVLLRALVASIGCGPFAKPFRPIHAPEPRVCVYISRTGFFKGWPSPGVRCAQNHSLL
jgi:hypothetical protein